MARALVLLLLAVAAHSGDKIERRDSGKRAGKQSVAVSGHAISYESSAKQPFVRSILIHGARYGQEYDPTATNFEIAICDKLTPLVRFSASYAHFSQHIFTWVEIRLPKPVLVPRRFRVVVDFRATATKGVYVGYAQVPKSHSSYFRIGGREQAFAKGKEWMIRVRTSASASPLPRPARDPRKALRRAQVPRLDAADLASTLARLSDAANVPIVLDGPSGRPVPEVPAGSAEAALNKIAAAASLAWDVRWGVAYVATRERLERTPVALPETASETPTPPAIVALRTELARRRVDLACRDLPLEQAVAQVSDWLEFRVRWDPRVDRRQLVTIEAESLRARDALSLLLLPRGCAYRITKGGIMIVPAGS